MGTDHAERGPFIGSDESDPARIKHRYQLSQAISGEFGDVLILSSETADEALTPKRRELLNAIAHREIKSQNQLAEILDRDPGNVKRDLAVLIDAGVVGREKEGRAYRPYVKFDLVLAEGVPHPQ